MALQIIEQGHRNLVVKVDGGSETIDVTTLVPPCPELRLMEVQYNLPGADGAGAISWDATTDVVAVELNNHEGKFCFQHFGGIPNNAGAGKTGNVIIDATGGTVVATFRKVRPILNQ